MCALRVLIPSTPLMVAAAFVGGLIFSSYAISIPPAVAAFTTERSRRAGFSLVFASGIGIGVLAGLVGGRMPALLERLPAFAGRSLDATLLLACGVAALGALVASRLTVTLDAAAPVNGQERRLYPRDPAVYRFLVALLLWNVATGMFNPFFNVYFTRELGLPLGQVGMLFSAGQGVQVVALLMAPLILKRIGMLTGLALMQGITAMALAGLAAGPGGALAGMIYSIYVGSQYMSEPAIYSLLMERVPAQERTGTSALNFLIVSGGQALAASAAGLAVRHYGYRPVLAFAAATAVSAALLVRALAEKRATSLSKTAVIS